MPCAHAGALGTRTVHQADAKAQLLLRVSQPETAGQPANRSTASAQNGQSSSSARNGLAEALAGLRSLDSRQEPGGLDTADVGVASADIDAWLLSDSGISGAAADVLATPSFAETQSALSLASDVLVDVLVKAGNDVRIIATVSPGFDFCCCISRPSGV